MTALAKTLSIEIKQPRGTLLETLVRMRDEESMAPLATAVVHPVDTSSFEGAQAAAKAGFIRPLLIAPEDKLRAVAAELGQTLDWAEIVPVKHSDEAAEVAVELCKSGKAEAIMKGKIHTDEMMAPIVNTKTGLRTGRRMSHVVVLDVPNYHKLLYLTDVALNIRPDLTMKKHIVQNAIDLFRALNGTAPKVAILSAVETVDEKIPSTLDACALCKMAERGQITGGILDGPLALDNAISKEAAAMKGITSPVAGDADILVTPDLESGNILFKQMCYLFKVEGAAIVLGARVPIILTSRAGTPATRAVSAALAQVFARKKAEGVGHVH
jgi:phosphate acetyltransferase